MLFSDLRLRCVVYEVTTRYIYGEKLKQNDVNISEHPSFRSQIRRLQCWINLLHLAASKTFLSFDEQQPSISATRKHCLSLIPMHSCLSAHAVQTLLLVL